MCLTKTELRILRVNLGKSHEQLAKELGVTLNTYRKWEATKKGISSVKGELFLSQHGWTLADAHEIVKAAKEKQRALLANQRVTQSGVSCDVTLGTSERGYPILLSQMINWLQVQKPITPQHGNALIGYIEQKIEEYEALHPQTEDDLI